MGSGIFDEVWPLAKPYGSIRASLNYCNQSNMLSFHYFISFRLNSKFEIIYMTDPIRTCVKKNRGAAEALPLQGTLSQNGYGTDIACHDRLVISFEIENVLQFLLQEKSRKS